jgi:hypothetical protein
MVLLERYETILHRLRTELLAHYGGRLVTCAVFGSVGRGTPRDGSDIDLLVIVRNLPSGRMRRMEEFLPVEDRLAPLLATSAGEDGPPALSPVLKTPEEARSGSSLFLDMVEDARILYDEGGFFAGCLERLRSRLRQLGAQRIRRGNAWHWVLKPDLKPGEVFEL